MSINPFRTSKEQASEREKLAAAFNPDAKPSVSNRAVAGQLLPHYVSGKLRQLETGLFHLDAPLYDLVIQEPFAFDAATAVYSLYGDDLSAVPVGSRVEAGTPPALRHQDGTRHANWVNVNCIYSHGQVISVADESTITLQQAHKGSVRTLLADSKTKLHTKTGKLEGVEAGDQVFFTGLAETAELSCPRIHLITFHQMGGPDDYADA
jgi:hypothetical protein